MGEALACAPHEAETPLDSPADPCGVVDPTDAPASVDVERLCAPPVLRFARGSAELDDGATCPLAQVAACLVGLDRRLIISGHAASGEVASEEAAILLADRRVMAVRAILRERGVPSERAQAIAYGTLEASDAYDPREQRVELLWQGEG
ncbi:MAG: OmpA family protein, partial [Myxococcales bacterium]|nr:OmpA family protein [Myxococcales bacterium]